MIHACRTASARRITAVIPNFRAYLLHKKYLDLSVRSWDSVYSQTTANSEFLSYSPICEC